MTSSWSKVRHPRALLTGTTLCIALTAIHSGNAVPALEIGATVPVSEPRRAFVEPFVAADPTDSNRLLVTVSQIDTAHGILGRVFTSRDGGKSWHASDIADIRLAVETGRINGIEDMWAS